MTTEFWYSLDGVTTIISCLVTLFYGFPAYKRTKQVGFVFWAFGALGSIWNTITLRAFGSDPRGNPAGYLFFHQSYRVMFIVDAILGIIGTVLVINGYLLLFEAKQRDAPPTTHA